MALPSRNERIEALLRRAFAPSFFLLENLSSLHADHNQSARSSNDTHYKLTISSTQFVGKSRIATHRMIMELLEDEFSSGLHALEVVIR